MPCPKQQQPWIAADYEMIRSHQPTCDFNLKTGQDDDCRSRVIWLGLYRDFADHRKVDVPQIHSNWQFIDANPRFRKFAIPGTLIINGTGLYYNSCRAIVARHEPLEPLWLCCEQTAILAAAQTEP
jgi:hypothetical protein